MENLTDNTVIACDQTLELTVFSTSSIFTAKYAHVNISAVHMTKCAASDDVATGLIQVLVVNAEYCRRLLSIFHALWLTFLPARRYASAGYSDRNVSLRPSAPVLCQNEES